MMSYEQKMALRVEALSFRHSVGRSAKAPRGAAKAWLQRSLDANALQAVDSVVIIHRLSRDTFTATGVIGDVSLAAYEAGRVKGHEATIAKTQNKMLEYMQSTRILGNPVALAHRENPSLTQLLAEHTALEPDVAFTAVDDAHHSLWLVAGQDAQTLCDTFSEEAYVTDGHHRLSAATALAASEGRSDPQVPGALFAESQLKLGAYARIVQDDSIAPQDLIDALAARFELVEVDQPVPRPNARAQMGVRTGKRSFLLTFPDELIPQDTYERLDVNLLQDLILNPLLKIKNPRTDTRLSFSADSPDEEHRVDSCDAWFLPYPAAVRDVMSVADSGRSMPPKSTFFMPKVPSGLVVRQLPSVD